MLTFSGIPSLVPGLRSIVWKLILGSLPPETSLWQQKLDENYEIYENFKKQLIVKPGLDENPL
jgi:hypothetical protein